MQYQGQLGHHWLSNALSAIWHQAIIWNNDDLSIRSRGTSIETRIISYAWEFSLGTSATVLCCYIDHLLIIIATQSLLWSQYTYIWSSTPHMALWWHRATPQTSYQRNVWKWDGDYKSFVGVNILNKQKYLRYRLGHIQIGQMSRYVAAKPSLKWHHDECNGLSNHQPRDCLLNCLFRHRSKKISKLRVIGLCVGNSPVTGVGDIYDYGKYERDPIDQDLYVTAS